MEKGQKMICIPESEFKERIIRIQAEMEKYQFDAVAVYGDEYRKENLRYVCNFWPIFERGICVIPNDCVQEREDLRYVPIENWHQALYMCILYDKWLEPPVWTFVERLVKVIRKNNPET